jgi:hypothetical protein
MEVGQPVRHPLRTSVGRDEDKDLKGPAASREASQLSVLFDTLRHREWNP